MATIDRRLTQDGRVSYRVRVRVRGRMRTATFARKTDAKDWARTTETKLKHGRYVPTTDEMRRTVADMVDRYVQDVLPHKPKNRDRRNVETQLDWWKGEIGKYQLGDVTPGLLIECRDKLSKEPTRYGRKRSTSTVNRYLAALSKVLNTAVKEWQWLPESPLRNVSKLGEPRGRVRFLSDGERKALLHACKASSNPDLYLIVVLALSTGARKNEILSLRWDSIDLNRATFTVQDSKNEERRTLPLAGPALDFMKSRAKVRRIDTNLVFPGRKKRQPPDIKKAWYAALEAAEIEDFRFHDLRHSAASYLAMNGATLAELSEILGHKTLDMVKRYAHLTEAHTAKVVARMNRDIFG